MESDCICFVLLHQLFPPIKELPYRVFLCQIQMQASFFRIRNGDNELSGDDQFSIEIIKFV